MQPSISVFPPGVPTATPTGHRCLMCGKVIRLDQAAVWLVTAAVHEGCGLYQPRGRGARGVPQAEAKG